MPIYEYQCKTCHRVFEKLVRRATEALPACPTCGGRRVAKQFSTFSAAVAARPSDSCSLGKCPSGSCAGGGCQLERG